MERAPYSRYDSRALSEGTLVEGAVLHETYELISPLGRGGMGAVWRARHLRLPREVAIKVLHEHAYESEEILQRFRREAEITSRLGHPHIVEVSDFNVLEDGRAYLVMELLEGQSLRDRLRQGPPLRLEEVGQLLDQVSSALSRAHGAGIVHRDLKPENIFLVDAGIGGVHAKVLDFGISKMQGAQTVLTQGASLMGTPRYMSPEQAQGDNASVDGRADQFSIGAIAYELLAGRTAFSGGTVTQVLLQVLQEDPEPLNEVAPDVPPAVAAAVTRALAKLREDRFTSMDAFRDALRLALGGAPVGTTPSPRSRSEVHTEPDAIEDTVRRPSTVATDPPAASTEQPRPSGIPVRLAVLVAGVGLAAGLGATLWWGGFTSSPALTDAGVVAIPLAPDLGAALPDTGAAPAEPSIDAAVSLDAGETVVPDAGRLNRVRRPVRPAPMGARLQGAYAALRKKDYTAAQRLARQSLREDDDPRAHAVLAIVACARRDLGGARAALRSTPARARRGVRRRCADLGMDL